MSKCILIILCSIISFSVIGQPAFNFKTTSTKRFFYVDNKVVLKLDGEELEVLTDSLTAIKGLVEELQRISALLKSSEMDKNKISKAEFIIDQLLAWQQGFTDCTDINAIARKNMTLPWRVQEKLLSDMIKDKIELFRIKIEQEYE